MAHVPADSEFTNYAEQVFSLGLGMPSVSRSSTGNRLHRSRHSISRRISWLSTFTNNLLWESYRVCHVWLGYCFRNCTVRKPLSLGIVLNRSHRIVPPL